MPFKKEWSAPSALQDTRPNTGQVNQRISHCFTSNLLVKAKCLYCICFIIFRSSRTWVRYKPFPGWIFTIRQIKWVTDGWRYWKTRNWSSKQVQEQWGTSYFNFFNLHCLLIFEAYISSIEIHINTVFAHMSPFAFENPCP